MPPSAAVSTVLQRFDHFRHLIRGAHIRGLRLNDLALLFTLARHHPKPVPMAVILTETSISRQTAHHHLNAQSHLIQMAKRPARVTDEVTRAVRHYELRPEGVETVMKLLGNLTKEA